MNAARLSRTERLLTACTRVQAGEGPAVALLCVQAFALMGAYYMVRPVREAFILSEGGAELRNYAVAAQALLLIMIVPAYGAFVRRVAASVVFQRVCLFFALNLVLLAVLASTGIRLGLVFFIWASLFGVMTVTQFWAFAIDLLNVQSGHRLLGLIAVGAACGAWIGSRFAAAALEAIGPHGLMLCAAGALASAGLLSRCVRARLPAESRNVDDEPSHAVSGSGMQKRFGGFAVIARSRYLACIAALVVLLNWITSAGEYVLTSWLVEMAQAVAPHAQTAYIGRFMANYGASITLLSFLIQLLLVSRIILLAGIVRALMVTPIAFLAGYLLIGIVPLFALVQSVLVVQRSLDYSLLSTTRTALLLPTSREAKFQAKTAIDTFFYRLGDLLATVSICVGTKLFADPKMQVVWLILILSAAMTVIAWLIGREYARCYGARGKDAALTTDTPGRVIREKRG